MNYNFHLFDIEGQLKKELKDFFETKIKIGGAKESKEKGYRYNQADTLNLIEFVGASMFEKGDKDSEGQYKFYLNSSVFRADVASKNVDIDVSNFEFIPDDFASDIPTIFARKLFKDWAKNQGLGIDLNDIVENYPFYGTVVLKERGREYDILDLNKLRNQQDAKSLNEASYVIIEHTMKMWEAQAMPDWDLSGLQYEWDDDITVYERYGRVPKKFFDATTEDDESVDTVSYICLDKKGKKEYSQLLFIEEITKRPFKEAHWKRRHGRWLGVGEIENNFENQKARNAVFNMRMRSTMWSAKNIFQQFGEGTGKNLVTEVRDGDVLVYDNANGQINPVNTQTKALADYNAADETLENNSDQKSFTYAVATGEQLQSGTPFRLGVLLSNKVNEHFNLKREKLILMLKEWFYDIILPSFEKELTKERVEIIFQNTEAYEELAEMIISAKVFKFVKDKALKEGRIPSLEEQEAFRQVLTQLRGHEVKILKDELKNIKYKVDIVADGESINYEKKIETLTNLYTALAQRGDPRADQVLSRLIVLTGEKLPAIPQISPLPQIPQVGNEQTNETAI